MQYGPQPLDCLVLQDSLAGDQLIRQCQAANIFLPALFIYAEYTDETFAFTPEQLLKLATRTCDRSLEKAAPNPLQSSLVSPAGRRYHYHAAEIWLAHHQLAHITHWVELAISDFLKLPNGRDADSDRLTSSDRAILKANAELPGETGSASALILQQQRLAEKLRERLGYLGVYYKRNPDHFWRNLSKAEQERLMEKLHGDYREIILEYFSRENDLNQKIDNFVTTAFLADLPVAKMMEIHMDLIDQFSKQLKLEGRNIEILQDYRLTLIDTLAHLCEMYRCSISREP